MAPSTSPTDRPDPAGGAAPAESADAAPGSDTGPGAESPDVRSGGHAGAAPRSLAESEAHWQEHDSSGASWDSGDSI